jgi:hypothetical protein
MGVPKLSSRLSLDSRTRTCGFLLPKQALCQLSYIQIFGKDGYLPILITPIRQRTFLLCGRDSNPRTPKRPDLQSGAFNHSATSQCIFFIEINFSISFLDIKKVLYLLVGTGLLQVIYMFKT